MWTRAAGVPAPLVVGVAFLIVVGLSSTGLSNGSALEEITSSSSPAIRIVGPKFGAVGDQSRNQAPADQVFRNIELAENQFSFVSGLDLSGNFVAEPLPDVARPQVVLTEKELIDQAVLRVAYAQFLVSLIGVEGAAATDPALIKRQVEPQQVPEPETIALATIEADQIVTDNLPPVVVPVFLDIVAPTPRMQSGNGEDGSQSVSAADVAALGFTPVPVRLVLTYSNSKIIAPTPAPASARPVLSVRPADVSVVRTMQDVSVDRLVHVDVQGSWPRRLDQINALKGASVLVEGRRTQRVADTRTLQRLPNGMVLVVSNN